MNLTQKILNAHLVSGKPAAGEEISDDLVKAHAFIRDDQPHAFQTAFFQVLNLFFINFDGSRDCFFCFLSYIFHDLFSF